jgi:hypothetical protein
MAKVLLGPVISRIAGSIGGCTFRNDRSGCVLSLRPVTLRKYTEAQLEHRAFISDCAAAWSVLPAEIKSAWRNLAQTQPVPDVFSRGRQFSGRQLFSCFYLQARHQYTPLPVRWLPTPPVFWPDLSLFVSYFCGYDLGLPDGWESYCYALAALPVSLDPDPAVAYEYSGAVSIWGGLLPLGSRRAPRSPRRIAPAPLSLPVDNLSSGSSIPDPCPHYYSGFEYSTFHSSFSLTLGSPRGVSNSAPDGPGQPPAFSFAVRASCVTDARYYYSPWLYGDCYASNGFIPAYANNDYQLLGQSFYTPTVARDWDVLSVPTSEY